MTYNPRNANGRMSASATTPIRRARARLASSVSYSVGNRRSGSSGVVQKSSGSRFIPTLRAMAVSACMSAVVIMLARWMSTVLASRSYRADLSAVLPCFRWYARIEYGASLAHPCDTLRFVVGQRKEPAPVKGQAPSHHSAACGIPLSDMHARSKWSNPLAPLRFGADASASLLRPSIVGRVGVRHPLRTSHALRTE